MNSGMDRRGYIGGSDAGAVCGVDKYRTAVDVYLDKIGQPIEKPKTCAMILGNKFEYDIAQFLEDEIKKPVQKMFNKSKKHDSYDWMTCQVDGFVEEENAIVECKVTTNTFGDLARGIIPDNYMIQCQHNMAVHGAVRAYLPYYVIDPSRELYRAYHVIDRNDDMIGAIIKIEHDFWHNHVLTKTPPALDFNHKKCGELLSWFYPQSINSEPVMIDNLSQKIDELDAIKSQINELESMKSAIENEVKSTLGDHEAGMCSNWNVTWKSQSRRTFDSKKLMQELPDVYEKYMNVSSCRVLRFKSIKEKVNV